ncbi:MAG: hypothetical protein FJ288_06890 [Planctomycetes bacterium]|nr:hypothetical protein [Planctomycetota bacterium]
MKKQIRRRELLAGAAATGTITIFRGRLSGAEQAAAAPAAETKPPADDLPRVDYHVHLDNFTLEKALDLARDRNVKLGIVEHAGTKENKYPVVLSTDEDLKRHIAALEGKGVYKGIQAEGLDWMTCFSKETVARLDYVLTDALTFREKDGRRVELWKADQVRIDDPQDFMDRYADFHVRIMAAEPIDILANVTFLPAVLQKDYDALWTEGRMRKVIDAAVKYGVAVEVSQSGIPRAAFLAMAKAAGAKFSFGSNGRGQNIGRIDRCLEAARQLGLKPADFFAPAPPGRKPVQARP